MQRTSKISPTNINIPIAILIGIIFSVFSSPAKAQTQTQIQTQNQNQIQIPTQTPTQIIPEEMFDNNGVIFAVDTVVEFEFVRSYGAYQSTFGVRNEDTGEETDLISEAKPSDNPQDVNAASEFKTEDPSDFLGTPGNTVPKHIAEFTFKAGNKYSFYLRSKYQGRVVGTLYSTDINNPNGNQQVRFEGDFLTLGNGGNLMRWDDTGSALVKKDKQDTDFDDFIIRAGGHQKCGC